MGYTKVSAILLFIISRVSAELAANSTEDAVNATSTSARSSDSLDNNLVYAELISCAVKYDTGCFVNAAEGYLAIKRNEILAEADRDVMKATGRSDPENMPSQLAKSIENMISNLMTMLRNAITGDAEEKGQAVAEDNKNQGEEVARNEIGEARQGEMRKNKDKPLHRLIRKILWYVFFVTKGVFLLATFFAALKFKYWLIWAGYFVLKAIKLFYWIKQSKHATPVHYEHHSPHHSEEHFSVDTDHGHEGFGYGGGPLGGHPYWGREDRAHDIAYAKQKPDSLLADLTL